MINAITKPIRLRTGPMILALLAVLLAACQAGSGIVLTPAATGQVLTPAPSPTPAALDFSAQDLDGNTVSLSGLRGQVILLNFWASWCEPCQDEMPVLQSFYQAHQSKGFTVLAVNVNEEPATAANFMNTGGFTFPAWSDPQGKLLLKYNIRGIPASFILDAEGRPIQFWSGPLDEDILNELVLPLLQP